ncbi:hypothetical protein ACH4TM_36245 [Streptomyces parvus]|uniref:hypothetical protein n=1 Tax=Streptomyces parvus TaxID=66428 RepID=UPI0037974CAD
MPNREVFVLLGPSAICEFNQPSRPSSEEKSSLSASAEGFHRRPGREFEGGDFVIAHIRVSGWHSGGDAALVDIFRFEHGPFRNGRVVEYRNAAQPYL